MERDAQNRCRRGKRFDLPYGGVDHDRARREHRREIEAEPDPLTIDLSEVERMDTVGAWLVYRTVRDRNAKVVGASEEAEPARPGRRSRQAREGPSRRARRLRSGPSRAWRMGGRGWLDPRRLLGFFGATLIAFANLIRRPKRFKLNAVVPVSTWSVSARSESSD
jgi:phospholipid/cholesterol/gamma-HCH transport system permease protein